MSTQVNTQGLQNKLKRIEEDYKKQSKNILFQGNLMGAEVATKWTPPPSPMRGKASATIPKAMYKRKCYWIVDFLRNKNKVKHETKIKQQARQALNKGNKYMIIKQSDYQEKVWFGKNAKSLKDKYQKIIYRGLYKLMYGFKFLEQGYKSNVFARLLHNSPQLNKFQNYENLKYIDNHNNYSVVNKNLIVPQRLISIHIKKAEKPMKDKMLRMIKAWTKTINNNK